MVAPLRILTLTPDGPDQEALVGRLEAAGAAVHVAGDCLTAMAVVKSGQVDMAVLAGPTGQFDAVDTARLLKSLRADRYLPVMVVAEESLPVGSARDLMEAQVDEILAPGFTDDILLHRLNAMLRLKGAHDQLAQVRQELEKTLARENALLKQLREDNRNLKVRSITDGLTALYNYRYLMEWLKTEFKIARRYGHSVSLLIVDLDHFKCINDEYGHPFGDHTLKELAVILKRCARESDLVARYAGDEFALVCPKSGKKEVTALAKRILAACRKHRFEQGGRSVDVRLSIGTATYPDDPEITSPELLVFLADQALYERKRLGRNGFCAWGDVDSEVRMAVRQGLTGPGHPLLTDDPKTLVELDAAGRLADLGVRMVPVE